ncbi:MAG: cyclic pyranopterin monophosphate synthase MoaC [Candidatus Bathyarchaeia archaeon]
MELTQFKKTEMVDITEKKEVFREASALGKIILNPQTILLIKNGKIAKGDPLITAEVAAIMAAKNTSQIIPLCHPIPITNVSLNSKINFNSIEVEVKVKTTAKTGVEMEALTAVAVYLLTIWDMVKQYEKDEKGQYPTTLIKEIKVKEKMKSEES